MIKLLIIAVIILIGYFCGEHMAYGKTPFQISYRWYEFCFDRWSYQVINENSYEYVKAIDPFGTIEYGTMTKCEYKATNKFNNKTKIVTKYLN